MNMRRLSELRRFGLLFALLCSWCLPGFAGAAPLATPPTSPSSGYFAPGQTTPTPDYYTTANWANTPPIAKFVNTLPGLTLANKNDLNQYLPVATADTTTFPGSDYYIIKLVEYYERLHSDLQPTKLRGYVQLKADGTQVDNPHYLGPIIVATKDRPVRLKFVNGLPTGAGGDLFIPVDETVMGAGESPTPGVKYTQNRADIHLHGGRTPWISDGTPHQWIVPAGEDTPYKQGVSMRNVPDMCFDASGNAIPKTTDPDCLTGSTDPGPGANTYYFTNQQSTRLMFYHDHAFGITRLNVYAGEAAGYVITDAKEQELVTSGVIPADMIPLIIQDKTFVNADVTVHPKSGGKVMLTRETDPLWNWGSCEAFDMVTTPAGPMKVCRPVTGDLWMPHVYMPAQLPEGSATGGVNPYGRWMYGPWFYPATAVTHGPVANPYYDSNCSSSNPFLLAQCETPGQPTLIPGTPNVSMGMEAFQDSAMVNGTVFPTLTVDPKPYRFRILNAASDRFQNLSFYVADSDPENISSDSRLNPGPNYIAGRSNQTEVKMAPASPAVAAANNWPANWPVDGREEMVPDPGLCQPGGVNCPNLGPDFIQIGTEGGFLPFPAVRTPQPVTYITDPTAFWVGVVDKTGLALGPAERADVIVDFSAYAGKTLILYNDAPAAWPARVPGYDYYTGAPDMRDSGGYGAGGVLDPETGAWIADPNNPADVPHGILPGYAPNTRTVMQVIVSNGTGSSFSMAALENAFTSTANPEGKTLFERTQEPIIVGQAAYSSAYPNSYFPANFPWEGVNQINDEFLQFVTVAGEEVKIPTEPKGIHDEMGASFDPEYGRMSGNLAMQLKNATTLNALLVLYAFSDIPTETVQNSPTVDIQVLPGLPGQPGTIADGTQIWKISHNGVDTHPIHFHIFDVQLVNRVGWDGQIAMPEPNELGWKDTIKISPLMDTIVAVRPRAPALPFGIPNSLRQLNPAIPIDSAMDFTTPPDVIGGSNWFLGTSFLTPFTAKYGFNSVDWTTGQAYVYTPAVPPAPAEPVVPAYPYEYYKGIVTNVLYDFGWEYVWHCHILSHEEMDMMRPIVLKVDTALPPAFTASAAGNLVTWTDPTQIDYNDLNTYGNPANEVGFNVYRSTDGSFALDPLTGKPLPNNPAILPANTKSYTATGSGDYFVVEAFNASGSTYSYVNSPLAATVSVDPAVHAPPFEAPGPIDLVATPVGFPAGVTISSVAFFDGASQIGSDATAPYTLTWNSASPGTHSITARIYHNSLGGEVVSPAIVVPVAAQPVNPLVVGFTPNTGSSYTACQAITFTSTSTGPIAGYSWTVNGVVTATTANMTLPANSRLPGSYTVTLTINAADGQTQLLTKTINIINNNPTVVSTGGPYNVPVGGTLSLLGSGADTDFCATLSYAWNIDNIGGYDFLTANPTVPYSALVSVLGGGDHTMSFKVADLNGGEAVATTTVTVAMNAPTALVVPAASVDGNYTVKWTGTSGLTYELQEAVSPGGPFTTVYTGKTPSFAVTGKANGSSFIYQVRAISSSVPTTTTAWTVGANACTTTFIAITAPLNGGTVVQGAPTTITAALPPAPAPATLTKVDYYSGATLLGSRTTAPLNSLAWTPALNVYSHDLKAVATYSGGITSTSAVVSVVASPALPTVTLATAPVGTVFDLGTTLTLTATPSVLTDPNPPHAVIGVSIVEFYDGATFVGYDFTAPYSITYAPATGGVRNLTAKAYYYNGATATSAIKLVTINTLAANPASIWVRTASTAITNPIVWGASPTVGATYEIEEATNSGFTTGVRQVYAGTGTPHPTIAGSFIQDVTVAINGTYYYRVRAVKTGYTPSSWINSLASVISANISPPASIWVRTASAVATNPIVWGASPSVGATYEVEEATNSGFTTGLRQVYAGAGTPHPTIAGSFIQDVTVASNGTYYYRVRAIKAGFPPSTWVNSLASVIAVPVAKPAGSFWVRTTTTTLTNPVVWNASPTTGATYEVEEATNSGFTTGVRQVYAGAGTPHPTIAGAFILNVTVAGNGTYYYRVRAVKAGSPPSDWVNSLASVVNAP